MGYITVADYMSFAGLTTIDSQTSTQVSLMISSTTDIINGIIGDISYSQKEEKISTCDIMDGHYGAIIACNNINIESLDEINNLSYTGVLNTDYQIIRPRDSRIEIRNISTYLSGLMFQYFPIKYTSGYATIPDDIKQLQYLMVASSLSGDGGGEVKSYTLGPRRVDFKTNDERTFKIAEMILSNYYIPII